MPKKPVQASIEAIRQEWYDSVETGAFHDENERLQRERDEGRRRFEKYVRGMVGDPANFRTEIAADFILDDGWRHIDVWVYPLAQDGYDVLSMWFAPGSWSQFPRDMDIPF